MDALRLPRGTNSLQYTDMDRDGASEIVVDAQLPVWVNAFLSYRDFRPAVYVYETNSAFRGAPFQKWPGLSSAFS